MNDLDQTIFGGKSDPYVVLTIGETHISFVDDYIENSVNPEYADVDGGDDDDGDGDYDDDDDLLYLICGRLHNSVTSE